MDAADTTSYLSDTEQSENDSSTTAVNLLTRHLVNELYFTMDDVEAAAKAGDKAAEARPLAIPRKAGSKRGRDGEVAKGRDATSGAVK